MNKPDFQSVYTYEGIVCVKKVYGSRNSHALHIKNPKILKDFLSDIDSIEREPYISMICVYIYFFFMNINICRNVTWNELDSYVVKKKFSCLTVNMRSIINKFSELSNYLSSIKI